MQWFDVDKAGLAKLLTRKGKEFIIYELLQNAWDELTSSVTSSLVRIPGTKYAQLTVEDDNPEGFVNLTHAFTLFAESTKKADANKRGRFNLGEKLVLAVCEEAEIASTKGTIVFDETGRHSKRAKRERGSVFTGRLRMTNEEIEECLQAVRRLIPPSNIKTMFNDETLVTPTLVRSLTDVALATEIADNEGYLRKTTRKTTLEIYEPRPDETGTLYEMGIPVVETTDRYHVNVMQKVPLNLDRDNVSPAYLSVIRARVLNVVSDELQTDDANSTWVKDALETHGDELASKTVNNIVELRFGPKRVAYDPSDPEANKLAVSQGYHVVHGNEMSKAEWNAVRRVQAILPAGQVTPSPKPFTPDGKPLKYYPVEKWTGDMTHTVNYMLQLGMTLIKAPIKIDIANDFGWPFLAAYGDRHLTINLARVGHKWFTNRRAINELFIHELGHEYSPDHLSSEYHDALCRLGAGVTEAALTDPDVFKIGS